MIATRIRTGHRRLPTETREQARESTLRCVTTDVFDGRYEIRSTNQCIGRLQLHGLFRPSVNASTHEGRWVFEQRDHSVVVRSEDSHHELATIDMSFSDHGGILRLRDGRALVFTADFWKGRAEFQTPSGDPVLQFRFHGLLRPSAEIEVLEKGRQLPELSWLLMLGWSLIVGYL